MKMEFPVVTSVDFSKVKVGDKVRFTLSGSPTPTQCVSGPLILAWVAKSGSLAIFAAILRASSFVSDFAADRA